MYVPTVDEIIADLRIPSDLGLHEELTKKISEQAEDEDVYGLAATNWRSTSPFTRRA